MLVNSLYCKWSQKYWIHSSSDFQNPTYIFPIWYILKENKFLSSRGEITQFRRGHCHWSIGIWSICSLTDCTLPTMGQRSANRIFDQGTVCICICSLSVTLTSLSGNSQFLHMTLKKLEGLAHNYVWSEKFICIFAFQLPAPSRRSAEKSMILTSVLVYMDVFAQNQILQKS